MRRFLTFCVPALAAGLSLGSPSFVGGADPALEARLGAHVTALTHPGMHGRGPATEGLAETGKFVQRAFEAAGLEPGTKDGWRQTFQIVAPPAAADVQLPEANSWEGLELFNVVGVLPGTAEASERFAIVFGAHYDHLGMKDQTPYPGADDNASGVAILVELARTLAAEGPFAHDLVFVAFSGEELGLLGSRAYVADPARPLASTRAMLNFDTVGRMSEGRLFVLGSGTALEFREALEGVNLAYGLTLEMPDSGPFASDQVPFAEKGVPVLHFFTGPNVDYHRASDTADKLSLEGMATLTEFAAELGMFLGDRDQALTFVPPGATRTAPAQAEANAAPRRVSLGTIPDFGRESGGVLLSGVMPGSPAEKAGLQKGDLLIELDGIAVDNLTDFTAVLRSHAPGDEVEVVVQRGDEQIRERVTLAERSR